MVVISSVGSFCFQEVKDVCVSTCLKCDKSVGNALLDECIITSSHSHTKKVRGHRTERLLQFSLRFLLKQMEESRRRALFRLGGGTTNGTKAHARAADSHERKSACGVLADNGKARAQQQCRGKRVVSQTIFFGEKKEREEPN